MHDQVEVRIDGQRLRALGGDRDRRLHPSGDPNDGSLQRHGHGGPRRLTSSTSKTGEVLAEKKFTPNASDGREQMLYAIPSTPRSSTSTSTASPT